MLNATLNERIEQISRREAVLLSLAFVFLLLMAASLSLSSAARFSSWQQFGDRWAHWGVLLLWLLGALLLRNVLARSNSLRDPLLFPIPMLFMGWGMLTIWRLDPAFGLRQTGWFFLAISSIYLLLRFGKDLNWIRRYRYIWVTTGLLLMGLTLLLGTHPGGGSPRLWLGCCGFYFQPSEALRLFLVAFLAAYLADRLPFERMRSGKWTLKNWLPLLLIWILSFLLLVVQRDLGTGMLFLALLTMLLYLVTKSWKILFFAGGAGLLGGWLGAVLFDVVRVRIEAWLNPFADPLGGSYQIIQSLITLASGGLFGRGMGLGFPGFVPAIHTDFIFTAIIEEHGLLAGLTLLGLWGLWLSRLMLGVLKQQDPFAALLQAGLTFSIGLQTMLIIGGNLRVFPLVGITLPFTSYGGTSLLMSSLSLGILLLLSKSGDTHPRFRQPLQTLNLGMAATLAVIAVALTRWTLVESSDLLSRGDNPRSALDSRFSPRGSIVDRSGTILAETIGSIGSFERVYTEPSVAPLLGYDRFPYGQAGIEASLDGVLRGMENEDLWQVNWSVLTRGVSPAGSDVRLTLDLALQRASMEAIHPHRGAIVLIDADSGDVLSAASSPSYNPNLIERDWSELIGDPASPLLNRAIQGQYQPGTTLAPLIIAWALADDVIELETNLAQIEQPVSIDGALLRCASLPDTASNSDYIEVLQHACPGPLQNLVRELGIGSFNSMIDSFGLSYRPGAALGLDEVLSARVSEPDELGMAAIGQSSLTVSPLQLARALSPLFSAGTLPEVRVVDAYRSPEAEWRQFGERPTPLKVIPENVTTNLLTALANGEHYGYEARAIGGEELGWFLGGTKGLVGNYAIVVVLESGDPNEAADIGKLVLDAVKASSIP